MLTTNHSQLRCGRERPRCTRCDRLDATCQYPSPPNRRGPRGQRNGTQRLQRATERGRKTTRPRRATLQRPSNGPRPQHVPTQRLNAAPRHRITSLGHDNSRQGDTFPDNDDESDDMSAPPVTGTPVLSNVRTTTHFRLHRTMTDGCIVLPNTVARRKLIRNRTRPCFRSATVTTDGLWAFSARDILFARV